MRKGQDPNWRAMFALMGRMPLTDDDHREIISQVVRREITSRAQLTPLEVRMVRSAYEGYLFIALKMRDARARGQKVPDPPPEAPPEPRAWGEQ